MIVTLAIQIKIVFFVLQLLFLSLLQLLKDLKPSKNCIANCISSTLLKKCIDHVALPLLYICNLAFDIGTFPEQLKISKIVPVYKKGSKSLVSNYRPISITNPISKVFEKLIHARMVKYLDKYKLLYDYQCGFRKNHSTSYAVIDIVSMIQKELFHGNNVLGIFMDLQKAFDTVNFDILLKSLSIMASGGSVLPGLNHLLLIECSLQQLM